MIAPRPSERPSINCHLLAGAIVTAVLTMGIGGWAATTDLAGAVMTSGSLVVDSNVKKVQHLNGGVVGELRVRDGDSVRAGDVLVRLDDTITRANLAIVAKGLDELTARKARLEGERDGVEQLEFPEALAGRAGDVNVARVVAGERKLFELRRFARMGQKSQLRQRIGQLHEEISGLNAQQQAKAEEIGLIERELEGVRALWDKSLVQLTRLTALEREATRLKGERAQLTSTMAQARGKISEIELQILQIDQDLSSEVAKELRDIDARVGELVERRVAAQDQLKRIDIRAPQDGVVHQLAVHTVGGIITAGDTIMLIVPAADGLDVEARIAPQDIDQIGIGQDAALRFSNFNQRTTPEINGKVSRVSADVSVDQRTGISYFLVRIAISPAEIARIGEVRLVPGMPVEVFVKTAERTVLSYLIKPLQDQIMRAFREK